MQSQPALSETQDLYGAFPRLSDRQLALLAEHGERRRTRTDEVLFREGDRSYDFFVVLEGKVAIVDNYGGDARLIAVHGPGRFLGELSLLTGETAFFTAVVRERGEVLRLTVEQLKDIVLRDQALGDMILRAYIIRREILIRLGAGLRIVGSRYSPDTRRLREFATRNRLPHSWIDLEEDSAVEALLRGLGVSPDETPVVIWRGSRVLRNPSNAELARVVGLRPPGVEQAVADLVVVGAGPAGLAAAVYGASEGLRTVTMDAVATGGQAGTSSRIENYLGFPAGISGAELAERATIQARKFGAAITVPAEAEGLMQEDGLYVIRVADESATRTRAVIIATGARYRRLPVERREEFEGTSIYYAATPMEANQCRGDPVAVVGGGNSAGQGALFLAEHTPIVRLIVREDDLGESMSRYLVDRIERTPNIEVLLHTEVRELIGHHGRLEALEIEDNRTGVRGRIEGRSLFVFIGAEPHTGWLRDELVLDERGFVVTGPGAMPSGGNGGPGDTPHRPQLLESSRPGVFAVGDVRSGSRPPG
jgi:thioredoxin reductase (NADPH)